MSEGPKLYKCYKTTCNKCNEVGLFFTEQDFKRSSENKILCPDRPNEPEYECGIKEARPEDLPTPPRDKKKLILIGGGIAAILVIAGIIFMLSHKKSTPALAATNQDTSINKLSPQSVAQSNNTPTATSAEPEKPAPTSPADEAKKKPDISDKPQQPKTGSNASINNLEKCFLVLSDHTSSDEAKDKMKKDILNLFTSPNVEVIKVNSNQNTRTGMNIGHYVESICINHRIVTIVDTKINANKISEIYVSEK